MSTTMTIPLESSYMDPELGIHPQLSVSNNQDAYRSSSTVTIDIPSNSVSTIPQPPLRRRLSDAKPTVMAVRLTGASLHMRIQAHARCCTAGWRSSQTPQCKVTHTTCALSHLPQPASINHHSLQTMVFPLSLPLLSLSRLWG